MANTNDGKILKLKEQIEIKKASLKKIKKFSPITNCSIELEGNRYNLNVLDKHNVLMLITKLNMYKISFENLKLSEEKLCISGYDLDEWILDLKAKYEYLSVKSEEKKLRTMEDKLDVMLSEEKKVELELNSIEDFLKN